jgi:hypothetical protein
VFPKLAESESCRQCKKKPSIKPLTRHRVFPEVFEIQIYRNDRSMITEAARLLPLICRHFSFLLLKNAPHRPRENPLL